MPLYAALAAKIDSVVSGVRLGTITYSFRQLPRTPGASDAVDVMINALTECGIGEIELFSPDLEPAGRNTAPPPVALPTQRRHKLNQDQIIGSDKSARTSLLTSPSERTGPWVGFGDAAPTGDAAATHPRGLTSNRHAGRPDR